MYLCVHAYVYACVHIFSCMRVDVGFVHRIEQRQKENSTVSEDALCADACAI